nr:hypothetical protein [Lachnospiraceae bacterium]
MVELFEQSLQANNRQSSKGNQLKWKNGDTWYKADYTGYEGLAEYMVSHLLQKSTLSGEEFVIYDPEEIKYKTVRFTGAQSRDFLKDDWQIITLERLFQNYFGESLNKAIYGIADHKERLKFIVNQVERVTGLKDFGVYMNKLFTIDAFFLNEDRHTHNIAVLMNQQGEFSYCPIFDHGAGLLADTTMDYPMGEDVYELMKNAKSKTICPDFDEQLDISEELYGSHLKFDFTKKDVKRLSEKAAIYSAEEISRVENIIYSQMNKYKYLF